jgi:hypothetical protein
MKIFLIAATTVLALGACTTMPTGPAVTVLPGTGKTFDQFKADDFECRQWASAQVGGGSPDGASESSGLKSAAVGAAAGALIGGRSGAASGAGAGLIVGSAAGAGAAGASQRTLQQRYDIGYQQCMYAKGHRVPVAGRFESSRAAPASSAPAYAPPPPPPPGTPPPPPPGAR